MPNRLPMARAVARLKEGGQAVVVFALDRPRSFILSGSAKWEEAGRAHGEVFRDIRPATSFIGVSGFVDPAILVEIEATAIVAD